MKARMRKPAPKTDKKLFEKWQSWVALISAMVVLIGALTDLPKKILEAYRTISPSAEHCEFYGRIVDERGGPVIGAEVIVQGGKGSGKTDVNGEFKFAVSKKKGTRVQVLVKKAGKIRYNGGETLPGPVTITLKETP
jgi:hypothetical protein